jgi:hypothetical protein
MADDSAFKRLEAAVREAIAYANGHEDEWGERAKECFRLLEAALPVQPKEYTVRWQASYRTKIVTTETPRTPEFEALCEEILIPEDANARYREDSFQVVDIEEGRPYPGKVVTGPWVLYRQTEHGIIEPIKQSANEEEIYRHLRNADARGEKVWVVDPSGKPCLLGANL